MNMIESMKLKLFVPSCLLLGAVLVQAAEPAPAVLMISIDGLHPSYVLEADKYGMKLPVLRSFVSQGAHAEAVVNVTPTVTYPNHTALVTGLGPRENGIYTNTVFDPEGAEKGAWNWYGAQIKAQTLWDAAKAGGLITAGVLWPVSVAHPAIDYNMPEYWRTKTQHSDEYLLNAVSTPRGFLESIPKGGPMFGPVKGDDGTAFDAKLTEIALAMIERGRPNLLTLHLAALDSAQHDAGPLPMNAHARMVLEKTDAMVGRLAAAMHKVHPQATIAIVSDHGFHPVNATVNLNAAFAAAGLIQLNQDNSLKSWKAYAWNSGGSTSVVLKDPTDQATFAAVDRLLAALAADPANGISSVLRGAEALAEGALPQASFLVDCKGGFAMGGALTGAVLQPQARTTGTHGYRNTHPEMNSAFFVIGPGVQAGRNLGRIDIRQIAPTLAKQLGVALPTARQPALALR